MAPSTFSIRCRERHIEIKFSRGKNTVYDCIFGDFPAKNTIYIYMVLANPKILYRHLPVLVQLLSQQGQESAVSCKRKTQTLSQSKRELGSKHKQSTHSQGGPEPCIYIYIYIFTPHTVV